MRIHGNQQRNTLPYPTVNGQHLCVPEQSQDRKVHRALQGGQAISHGQLVFQDLPAGASIRSCHGFVQDLPVLVRAASWGGLKLLYR